MSWRWIRWTGWLVLGALLTVAATNIVVDPYGVFRLVDRPGFNQQREGVRKDTRRAQALRLPRWQPTTVWLGSSRVQSGIDPADGKVDDHERAYNLGVPMLRIREARALLEHAIHNAPVTRVIIGVDFFMFNTVEPVNPTFDADLIGRTVRWTDYVVHPVLSSGAVWASLATVRESFRYPDRREFRPDGYRPGASVFYGLVDYALLHKYILATFLSRDAEPTPYYGAFALEPWVFDELDQLLRRCREAVGDCRLFIPPAHATLDGEVLRVLGLWPTAEAWKRRLTTLAESHGIPLWDFSGYNTVTTEPVRSPMRYYWDPSHFTAEIGARITRRVLGFAGRPDEDDGFGVRLTMATVDAHLRQVDASRHRWAAANPAVVADIEALNRLVAQGLGQVSLAGAFATR